MIYNGNGKLKPEEGEPALRSCWECNAAHEHLKKVNTLHQCFECGRSWIFDRFFDTFKNEKEFDDFFSKKLGLKKGESTTKIDKGYRITCITFSPEKLKKKTKN